MTYYPKPLTAGASYKATRIPLKQCIKYSWDHKYAFMDIRTNVIIVVVGYIKFNKKYNGNKIAIRNYFLCQEDTERVSIFKHYEQLIIDF